MKIECVREKLEGVISKAVKTVSKNPTHPVLSCIYLEAVKGELIIKATNLDVGIEITLPVKVIEEGSIAVPGQILHSFLVNALTEDKIVLETKELNLHIVGTNMSTVIKTHPVDEFPVIPQLTSDQKVTIKASKFIEGLKSVWYSAAISSMKPELSSVYVYKKDEKLIFVATDSFRLAEKKISAVGVEDDFEGFLIPLKNITEIIRVLESEDKNVIILYNENQIAFKVGGVYIVSRIIDGVFPDYTQIIPQEFKTEVTLLKDDLVNTLKVTTIFSDKFNRLSFHIAPSKKEFNLSTKNMDVGESVGGIKAVVSGEDLDINYNYRNIIDCFGSISADSVTMGFNGAGKPMVIRGVADESFMYLVMPTNK